LGCAGGSKTVQFSSTSNNPNQVVKVLVDDKEIGETPLTYNLTYGKHKITFDAQVINSTQEVTIDKDTESISYDTYASTISVTSKGDGPFNVSIEGEDLVEKVVLKDTQTGERTELQVQGVFVFAGMKPDTELFKGLVDMDEKGYIKTDEYMRTNVPGVLLLVIVGLNGSDRW